jgi:hypothetical protein
MIGGTIAVAIFTPLVIWAAYSRIGSFVLITISGLSMLQLFRRSRGT